MAIIKQMLRGHLRVVYGNGEGAPPGLRRRLGWFALIWLSTTVAFIGAASLLHLLIPK